MRRIRKWAAPGSAGETPAWLRSQPCGRDARGPRAALLALGVANVVPTVLSATRELPGEGSEGAVNGIVATTYLGFVVGPPAIGWLAELCGLLPAMLIFLAVVATLMYALSREVRSA